MAIWKIRLIAPNGSRVVRICNADERKRLTSEYLAQGYTLDAHELPVQGKKRTTNPSRL